MSSQTEAPIQAVKQWILANHPKPDDIDPDLDLIEGRLIDSLGFMDFVFFLEELVERDLDVEASSVDSFRTLRKIEETILQPVGVPA